MHLMTNTTVRLSGMMFLEYVIWGSWLPLLALYLGDVLKFTGGQIGWIFATQAIASVVALFVGGQIADRLMSSEKLLSCSTRSAAPPCSRWRCSARSGRFSRSC